MVCSRSFGAALIAAARQLASIMITNEAKNNYSSPIQLEGAELKFRGKIKLLESVF